MCIYFWARSAAAKKGLLQKNAPSLLGAHTFQKLFWLCLWVPITCLLMSKLLQNAFSLPRWMSYFGITAISSTTTYFHHLLNTKERQNQCGLSRCLSSLFQRIVGFYFLGAFDLQTAWPQYKSISFSSGFVYLSFVHLVLENLIIWVWKLFLTLHLNVF